MTSNLAQVSTLLLLVGLFGASGLAGAADPAPQRSGDVTASTKERIKWQYDRIRSFRVVYRVTSSTSDSGSRHVVNQMGRLRKVENVHFGVLSPELDLNHTIQFYDGRTLDVFNVNARYFETSLRNAKLPYMWKVRVDLYVTAVGWWPAGDAAPPDDPMRNPYRPVRWLLSDADCVVSKSEDQLILIERPGRERVWIDGALNYAVRKRENWDKESGKLLTRSTCSQFKHFGSLDETGHYLPTLLVVEAFGEDPTTPNDRTEVAVESLELNRLSKQDFEFELPPGTFIQNRDNHEFLLLPGGRDVLDHNIHTAAQIMQFLKHRARENTTSSLAGSLKRAGLNRVPQ